MPDLKTELKEKLVGALPQTEERQQRERAMSTPFYVRALVEKIGPTEAGAALGYTAPSLRAALRSDSISMTAEVAAKGVLREMGEYLAASQVLFLARVSPDKAKAFEAVSDAMQIDLTALLRGLICVAKTSWSSSWSRKSWFKGSRDLRT